MTLVAPFVWILPLLSGTGTWLEVAGLAIIHLFLLVAFVLLPMPIQILTAWIRHRNTGDTTTSLRFKSVLDVSQIRTTEISWRDVRRVVERGGDVFIHSARKGILVPREAFKSPSESESFARHAKVLRENAKNRGAAK